MIKEEQSLQQLTYRSPGPCYELVLCFSSAVLTFWSFLLPSCCAPLYFNYHGCPTRNKWGSLVNTNHQSIGPLNKWTARREMNLNWLLAPLHKSSMSWQSMHLTAPERLVCCLPALFQAGQTLDLSNVYTSVWQLSKHNPPQQGTFPSLSFVSFEE